MRHPTPSPPARPDTAGPKSRWLVPAAVTGIELFCLLLFLKFAGFTAVFAFLAFALILYLISFSVRNTLIAMFLSVSLLPVYAWGSRYKFFKGIYYNEIIVYFFLALIIVWALYSRLTGTRRDKFRWSGLEISLVLFLATVVFAALRGLVENTNTQVIYNETHHLLLYGFFFIYARLLSDRDMMDLLHAVPVITAVVSIEFILLVASEGGLSSLFVKRIVTQQPHLAQAAIPLLVGSFVLPQKRIRLWSVAAFLPVAAMVFFCQQRGLWVGVFLATVLVLIFNFLKNRFTIFRFLKVILALVLILTLLAGVLWIIDWLVTGSVFFTLFERLLSLTTVGTDTSMNIRMSEIRRALDLWDNSPVSILLGTGLGSEYDTVDISRTYGYSVDNSFAFLLWKTGLVGLLLFVSIFLNAIRKGFSLLRLDLPPEHRHAASALTAALIGLCFIAFTNACIVSYRFILIWSFMIYGLHRLHAIHLSKARA